MPQALEADVIKSVNGNAVVVGNDSPRERGRPVKLTVKRFLAICTWIQQGKSNTLACRAENVDYTTFRLHVRNKPRWRKRYEHADAVRDEFLRDVHLTNIIRHAEKNWLASAWILERKFPHLFALHFANRDNANAAEQPIGNEIPAERLAEYGRLMLEFAEENKAREAGKAVELLDAPQGAA